MKWFFCMMRMATILLNHVYAASSQTSLMPFAAILAFSSCHASWNSSSRILSMKTVPPCIFTGSATMTFPVLSKPSVSILSRTPCLSRFLD